MDSFAMFNQADEMIETPDFDAVAAEVGDELWGNDEYYFTLDMTDCEIPAEAEIVYCGKSSEWAEEMKSRRDEVGGECIVLKESEIPIAERAVLFRREIEFIQNNFSIYGEE